MELTHWFKVLTQHFRVLYSRLEHDLEEAFIENNRVDAIAMERLTASKHVINIYGFCGTSVISEYASKDLATVAALMDPTERLKLAIMVAQGLADVHSITRGRPSLVHNDLNMANIVITQDDRPVLNDFNIAILLMKHNETGQTCPFISHFPNPQWKAPEEQRDELNWYESTKAEPIVTEKIDIYALGNVLFRLAVGRSPWKRPASDAMSAEEKEDIARLKRLYGALPPVPDEIENSNDPAIQVILEAMRRTYRFDPITRPSAQEIVNFLQYSLDHLPPWKPHVINKTPNILLTLIKKKR